ncbi:MULTISPECIES: DUF3784 domain-containing protein [Bacillus]|jgi:hypothetical protein|uniref:YitR n=1 Tax=Bacillus licheniformis (strain ATCC 14580 / DSM 13 / JCM 2505 / CCUG 7422 / NBRC 12200 / NCIMB 9375 / NCTC 10341 / NRRL NRS-1264 / Gibson 46) TaxID=279010 RepID=Q65LJ0_BACLD|nr:MULTISPECIES: DUF3784 domain-containing protein [Bacillus]AAU22727.1 YitR [Bacillus licheniformis DSM 13 = ATCC 14580]AAU40074.1 YitR [Bacillus licheniformis DSM 13 = ATCC 14580]MBG9697490.1 hypothetical protein [Bacillus licheniformis]MCQ5302619.1 DUF3784 domain-containing protein [Bacillus licheniformis]MCR3918765.1 DUF3784 domain-containing protein [Bacillus licheniformis]
MYFQLNPISIAAALLFFAAAYAVGIKKQTWILRGFRRERVRDQVKLAKIAGYFFLNSGFLLFLNGVVYIPYQESFTPSAILAYGICTMIYVQKTMAE